MRDGPSARSRPQRAALAQRKWNGGESGDGGYVLAAIRKRRNLTLRRPGTFTRVRSNAIPEKDETGGLQPEIAHSRSSRNPQLGASQLRGTPRARRNATEPRSAFVSPNVKQSSILAWRRVPFVCRALGDVPSSFWVHKTGFQPVSAWRWWPKRTVSTDLNSFQLENWKPMVGYGRSLMVVFNYF
jgi:hypothetical protein